MLWSEFVLQSVQKIYTPRFVLITTLIMNKSLRLASCAAGLLAFAVSGAVAAPDALSIQFVSQFDYPGTGTQTRPQKINDQGEVVGVFLDNTGASFGFTLRGSTFSPPIKDPNDAGNLTEGRGINNQGRVCGDYLDSAGAFEGFFLKGTNFKNYAPEPTFTIVLGINNAGDFCGSEIPSSTGVQSAFTNIGGVLEDFVVPNASATLAYQINGLNQVAGYYNDASAISHGWWMDTDGTVHAPIDPRGSTTTILFGNNDKNFMVGRYVDAAGATHGILFQSPNKFVAYDFPGATFTSLNGINRKNQIVGRYTDTAGRDRGLLLQVVKTDCPSGSELPMASPNASMKFWPNRPENVNPAY